MVWAGPAVMGGPVTNLRGWATPAAPRLPARLSLWRVVVHGQLLLGPRCHGPVWRYADVGPDAAAGGLQPGAGALLRALRPGRDAGAEGDRQHAAGAGRRAHPMGWAGAGRRAHHQRSVGPTGLLAGGQCAGRPACPLDWR